MAVLQAWRADSGTKKTSLKSVVAVTTVAIPRVRPQSLLDTKDNGQQRQDFQLTMSGLEHRIT